MSTRPVACAASDVKHNAFFAAHRTQGGDVLNDPDLVVHQHHAGQNRVGSDGCLERVQIHQAVALHVQVRHLKSLALQLAAGV